MKKQYRCLESYGFKYIIQLYHDGEFVKTHTVYLDKLEEAKEAFEASGYTYGYTEQEVKRARERYIKMLKNIIQQNEI